MTDITEPRPSGPRIADETPALQVPERDLKPPQLGLVPAQVPADGLGLDPEGTHPGVLGPGPRRSPAHTPPRVTWRTVCEGSMNSRMTARAR